MRKWTAMMRLAPRMLYSTLTGGAPQDRWERYWSSVQQTGSGGEVLWDTDDPAETERALARLLPHLDRSLPMLDLGCGNGRRTRQLAQHFARVVGVDISEAAIALARAESGEAIPFHQADLTDPEVGAALQRQYGAVNIYMRGVYHVIRRSDRPAFAANLRRLLGERGVLYQLETDGEVLSYMLEHPEDDATGLPSRMVRVLDSGVLPHGFGPSDAARWFPSERWEVLESGPTEIHMLDFEDGQAARAPAHFLIARGAKAEG